MEEQYRMKDFKESATEIARETGTFLRDRFNSAHTINYKGEINLVTEADKISEEMITSEINHLFPDHDILAEEFTYTRRGSDFRWIIDPLDGTTNYAHGYPVFCVSIALQKLDEIILGVNYNPMLKEMFVAEKGEGAFLNGREIQVSNTLRIAQGFIATGFPYDIREDSQNNLDYFNEMIMRARAIRRAGSAALDLAYVAAGRFDGFWELKLSPWDTAAGWLIVEEAGGVVTDFSGQEYFLESPGILASNGRIHKEMMDVLREASSIS
ncbi:MAG TPA: inositol monophosphatase family protein [Desulfatiglandales bacterium]|nr:inositol monophosphatase family protein [Desulfatiglandales bacterium]